MLINFTNSAILEKNVSSLITLGSSPGIDFIAINNGIFKNISHHITNIVEKPAFNFNGKTREMKTRRLSSKLTVDDFGNMTTDQRMNQVITNITNEYENEKKEGRLENFHPMFLAFSSGVVMDSNSGNLVITFLSRYYAEGI